jgi:hypothetical protein
VFASIASHRFAPYAQSNAMSYRELRDEPALDCDNYAYLALYIYEDSGGDPTRFRLHGFDGGTLGNHAQVWVADVMTDPTTGIAAHVGYEDAMAGLPATAILDTSVRDVAPGYRARIVQVVTDGLYPESSVLYDRSVDDWYEMLAMVGLAGREDARPWEVLHPPAPPAPIPSPAGGGSGGAGALEQAAEPPGAAPAPTPVAALTVAGPASPAAIAEPRIDTRRHRAALQLRGSCRLGWRAYVTGPHIERVTFRPRHRKVVRRIRARSVRVRSAARWPGTRTQVRLRATVGFTNGTQRRVSRTLRCKIR